MMELQNHDSRQQQQQQVTRATLFSLLDEDTCDSAGLPRFGDAMTAADAAAMASPLPGCEALNDGYDPTSSSAVLGVLFDSFPRCRSNTWHGRARNAAGRHPVSHHLTQQQSVFAIGGASTDDTEEDDVDDDEMERASQSTPSTSDPGDFTLNLGAGSGFGSGTALGSSGCGSSSSSSIAGGYDIASDLGAGGATFSSGSPVMASAAVGSSASRKSTSRRNAWGNLSYADLITRAIESSPDQRLTLSQIYAWMVANVPFFRDKGENNSSAGWKVRVLLDQ